MLGNRVSATDLAINSNLDGLFHEQASSLFRCSTAIAIQRPACRRTCASCHGFSFPLIWFATRYLTYPPSSKGGMEDDLCGLLRQHTAADQPLEIWNAPG